MQQSKPSDYFIFVEHDCIQLLNAETGQLEHRIPTPSHLAGMCVSADRKYLAVSFDNDERVTRVYELPSGKLVQTLKNPSYLRFTSTLSFSPYDSIGTLYVYSTLPRVVWDFNSGTLTDHSPLGSGDSCFSPDGKRYAYIVESGRLCVHNIEKNWLLEIPMQRMPEGYWALCFSPDGRFLVAGGPSSQSIRVYDVEQLHREPVFLPLPEKSISSLCFSPNGRYLFTGLEDARISMWDFQAQKLVHTFEQKHINGSVTHMRFCDDENLLFSFGGDHAVHVWNITEKKHEKSITNEYHGLGDRRNGEIPLFGFDYPIHTTLQTIFQKQ